MKRIYRGFKTECPTGLITEEAFHGIYSRFFPQGGKAECFVSFFLKIGERNIKKQNGYGLIRKKITNFSMKCFLLINLTSLDQFLDDEKSFWPYHELQKKLKYI